MKKNPAINTAVKLERNEIDMTNPKNIFICEKLEKYNAEEIKKVGFGKIINSIKKEWKEKNGKSTKKLKIISSFKNEEDEMDFWDSVNTSEYFGNGKIMSWEEIKAMIKKNSENNNR